MDDREGLVPHAYFDTECLPPEQRVEAWRQFISQLHEATPITSVGKPLCSISSSWIIDQLVFGWGKFQAQAMSRRKDREIERRYLLGVRYLSGSSHFIHDGEWLDVRPGAIYLLDQGRESSSIATDAHVHCFAVPYELVGYNPALHSPRFVFELDSPAGQMLANACDSVIDQAPTMKLAEAPEVAALFSGAVAQLIHWNTDSQAPDPNSRAYEIRRFITNHPAPAELTVEQLAEQFAMSRATLYRQLQPYGGLREYIEIQRLDNALRSLAFGPARRGRVTEVADIAGYSSVKQLSRSFTRKFGLKPSDLVGIFAHSDMSAYIHNTNDLWVEWNTAEQEV